MTSRRHFWQQNRGANNHSQQAAVRAGYYRRRPAAPQPRRSVDGLTAAEHNPTVLLPASKDEYLDALSGKIPNRAPFARYVSSAPVSVPANQHKRERRPRITFQKVRYLLPSLTILAIVIASVFVMTNLRSGPSAQAGKFGPGTVQDEGDNPSEKRPYNEPNYHVAPDLPRNLRISKLGINTRIVRTSVRANSEPAWPTNVYDAGWYENSAKPGEEGAALLVGHISGNERNGVFYDLKSLVPGDTIEVETGDGKIHHYYIVRMETYPRNQVDMSVLSETAVPGRSGLNLLGAVGTFERNADVVQQLVVFAVSDGVQSTAD